MIEDEAMAKSATAYGEWLIERWDNRKWWQFWIKNPYENMWIREYDERGNITSQLKHPKWK